jgi:hypothetical protein
MTGSIQYLFGIVLVVVIVPVIGPGSGGRRPDYENEDDDDDENERSAPSGTDYQTELHAALSLRCHTLCIC